MANPTQECDPQHLNPPVQVNTLLHIFQTHFLFMHSPTHSQCKSYPLLYAPTNSSLRSMRKPCCEKKTTNRGAWSSHEDQKLVDYISTYGEGNWSSLPLAAGLLRCGKSCRLRWINYLRPDLKRGNFAEDENDLIIKLHALLGNRWSLIAGRLPGRTDNEVKNHWNSHLKRSLKNGGFDVNLQRRHFYGLSSESSGGMKGDVKEETVDQQPRSRLLHDLDLSLSPPNVVQVGGRTEDRRHRHPPTLHLFI